MRRIRELITAPSAKSDSQDVQQLDSRKRQPRRTVPLRYATLNNSSRSCISPMKASKRFEMTLRGRATPRIQHQVGTQRQGGSASFWVTSGISLAGEEYPTPGPSTPGPSAVDMAKALDEHTTAAAETGLRHAAETWMPSSHMIRIAQNGEA